MGLSCAGSRRTRGRSPGVRKRLWRACAVKFGSGSAEQWGGRRRPPGVNDMRGLLVNRASEKVGCRVGLLPKTEGARKGKEEKGNLPNRVNFFSDFLFLCFSDFFLF